MTRKSVSIIAIAAVAVATSMFPSGNDALALAQSANNQFTPTPVVDAVELVPDQPITFVSQEVVQPLSAAPAQAVLTEAGSLADLVGMVDADTALTEEMRCLAGAVYFEARGEPLAGQLAVAQVIINRSEDNRFPRSYCGVVAQPGQFSFMRGSRMPAIRTGTTAWSRAVAIAEIADKGLWESEAGDAVFFHAKYVRPSWSHRKTRLAQIDTHIFYR
ncbi:spore germination cell wall hydrolase CwlJ-like protein [Porphyrobacter sp. MBR-155]|jgi:spore germination cell wall hydrolase CwlJ-like protein|uniref:cell wall hydrolase n=1 Tax=Porphyrobacter sp. MBR-155 TaxID=3156464 RepID=UPI0033977B1E